MAAKLVVAPEAELDIAEAYVWYESRRIGLIQRFPYAVFYEYEEMTVTVSRDALKWRQRLP